MKRFSFTLGVCVMTLALVLTSDGLAQKKKTAIVWPAGDIKWEDVKEGPPGGKFVNLWGNMTKGAYGSLVILPAGLKNPLHTHGSDIKMVVISGTFIYTPEGGATQRLGAGSYLMVPAGVRHLSGTGEDGPCQVFQESSGKFDMHPVDSGMMKK